MLFRSFARGELKFAQSMNGTFRLPGPGLDDVKDPHQRDLLAKFAGRSRELNVIESCATAGITDL